MTPAQFERILSIGLGRAILHLQSHDARLYRDDILYACLHCTSYDRQSEGDRAPYVLEVISLTEEVDYYRKQVLAALPGVVECDDRVQVMSLIKLFAERRDEEARRLLYEKVAANLVADVDLPGDDLLIELDGFDAFLYLLKVLDEISRPEDKAWEFGEFLHALAERYGKEESRAMVEAAAANHVLVRRYFDAWLTWKQEVATNLRALRGKERNPAELSYAELLERLREPKRGTPQFWDQWGASAAEEELRQAAADLPRESDPDRLVAYLRIFRKRPFPLDHRPLIALATNSDDRIAQWAVEALSQIAHPDVRSLAFALMESKVDGHRSWGVGLLLENFEPGDYAIVQRLLETETDWDELHTIGWSLIDLVKKHPMAGAVPALRAMYEFGPCSNCRQRCVELLHQLQALPAEIVAECRWDSNFGLREMARAW